MARRSPITASRLTPTYGVLAFAFAWPDAKHLVEIVTGQAFRMPRAHVFRQVYHQRCPRMCSIRPLGQPGATCPVVLELAGFVVAEVCVHTRDGRTRM